MGRVDMKKYIFNEYNICIKETPPYSLDSTDNKYYDSIIILEENEFNKFIEIEVERCGDIRTVLMVVPFYTPIESFVAPHRDGLFMMLNDVLCVFSPDNAAVIKQIRINPMGIMFEVHQLEDDYILYGEMEIYRISQDLNVKWDFSGRDIFVSYQGNDSTFVMKQDRICLYDFENNYYEINFEGKLIT